jgi:hypothetical protein
MIENTIGSMLVPIPLCSRFFEGNLDRAFFTTRGLLLPSRSGICSSKISLSSQIKKKEAHLAQLSEILGWHGVQRSVFQ